MSGRFDYVKYDGIANDQQMMAKIAVKNVEELISQIGGGLDPIKSRAAIGRSTALAYTKLEECYMWIGKALRDEQIARNSEVQLQEGRKDG